MFPKGYRTIFRAYEDYRKSSLFRSRMEAANELLTRLRMYAKMNVLNDFESFTNDLILSLKHDIEKRAKLAKPHQIDSDLMIIPDELDLRQFYLKTLKPKKGNNLKV